MAVGKIDITVIDEHVEAFMLWMNAKRKGTLGPRDVLLHVDSHDDFGYPMILDSSLYRLENIRSFTEQNLHIAIFIVPAAIYGCFSVIYDLRPANPPDPHKPSVSEDDSDRAIRRRKKCIKRKHTNRYYSWRDEGRIWYKNLTAHGRQVAGVRKRHIVTYYPVFDLKKIPAGSTVILDIDMDYFSCNGFVDYQFRPKLTQAQIKEAKRFSRSQDAYAIDLGLVEVDAKGKFIEANAYGINKKYEGVYNDDPVWIDYAIREFVSHIRKRFRTKVTSIARSVKTGYTPVQHADLIERALIENLKASEPIDTTPPYQATFQLQDDIFFDSQAKHIVNKRNLTEYYFENRADIAMWHMVQAGARFGDIIECLMKDFQFSREKAEKELIQSIWYLKKDMVLR